MLSAHSHVPEVGIEPLILSSRSEAEGSAFILRNLICARATPPFRDEAAKEWGTYADSNFGEGDFVCGRLWDLG